MQQNFEGHACNEGSNAGLWQNLQGNTCSEGITERICKDILLSGEAYRGSDGLFILLQILKQLVQGQLSVLLSGRGQPSLAPLPQLLTAASSIQLTSVPP